MNNRTLPLFVHGKKKLRNQFQKDKDLCVEFKAMLHSQGISMETFHDILLNSNDPKKAFQYFQEQFEIFQCQESPGGVTAATAIVYESDVDSIPSDDDLEQTLGSSWGEMDILEDLAEEAYFNAEFKGILLPSTAKRPILQQEPLDPLTEAKKTIKLQIQPDCLRSDSYSVLKDGYKDSNMRRPTFAKQKKCCYRATAA